VTAINETQWLLGFIAAQSHSIKANGIWRQHYDLRLHIDVALLLETHLKPHERYTELLRFWTFSIVWYSREHDVLETETDPVSEMLCSLEYQTMEKAPKPSNSVGYTPLSELFRIYP
jgi:hypothetical protein